MLRRYRGRKPAAGGMRRRRMMKGRGLMDWLKKAGSFIANNSLISKGADLASKFLPPQYSGIASTISSGAKAVGLGRRRGRRGGALTLAGAGYRSRRGMRLY